MKYWSLNSNIHNRNEKPRTNHPRCFKVKPCNENIKKALELVNDMIGLAEKGNTDREDDGCGILYGVLLDYAYKLKRIEEAEKERHIKKGWWK